MKETILVCEDDRDILSVISYNLEKEGFRAVGVSRGDEILKNAVAEKPSVILLDVMLPERSGLEVCREIRANPEIKTTPIILVSAKTTESDRVAGLEAGADDYVTKPFSMRELMARVKSNLRRQNQLEVRSESTLKIDRDAHKAYLDGKPLHLTLSEYTILVAVTAGNGKVLTRDELGTLLDESEPVAGRTIDVHIVSLRKKLQNVSESIETIRGVGYRFKSENFFATQ